MKRKWVRIATAVAGVLLVAVIIRCGLVAVRYRAVAASGWANWRITRQPFYSGDHTMDFYIDRDKEMQLTLWWDGVTGSVEARITDDKGKDWFREKANRINQEYSVSLQEGRYQLHIETSGFSGAIAVGYRGIVEILDLPEEQYTLVPADPAKGFMWEYLLYVPEAVAHGNLLVIPNNTGDVSDTMEFHRIKAKNLMINQSGLADALGVPLLVPVFP